MDAPDYAFPGGISGFGRQRQVIGEMVGDRRRIMRCQRAGYARSSAGRPDAWERGARNDRHLGDPPGPGSTVIFPARTRAKCPHVAHPGGYILNCRLAQSVLPLRLKPADAGELRVRTLRQARYHQVCSTDWVSGAGWSPGRAGQAVSARDSFDLFIGGPGEPRRNSPAARRDHQRR